ncbi:ABC transporter permease [Clostridium sediminicola]|uniref:ABC transporter permease n=1 Tax=Clostridium sediminicola TaxID=3114879 RepID=UPI0031F1EAED
MKNIILIALNFLRVTFKKKTSFLIYIILPVASALVTLMLYSSSGAAITKVGLINNDNSTISSDMINYLEETKKFKFENIKEEEVENKVANQEVDLVLEIPYGFTESIYNSNVKELKIETIRGMDVTAWIESYLNYYIKNMRDIAVASEGNREVFNKIYDNFKNSELVLTKEKLKDEYVGKTVTQQGIGFFILFILIGCTSITKLILKEKNIKTYQRICSSPVTSREYVLGNVLANIIIILVQICLLLFGAFKILEINIHMPVWSLFIILMLFGLAAIGIGMVIVSFSKSSSEAGNLSTLIITPTCMLGGCFWPLSFMPDSLKKISSFTPQKWVMEAIISIQSGKTINDVAINLAILVVFALVFFAIAAFKMKSSDKTGSFI